MMNNTYSKTGSERETHDRPSHHPFPTRAATKPTVLRMPMRIGNAKICRSVR